MSRYILFGDILLLHFTPYITVFEGLNYGYNFNTVLMKKIFKYNLRVTYKQSDLSILVVSSVLA